MSLFRRHLKGTVTAISPLLLSHRFRIFVWLQHSLILFSFYRSIKWSKDRSKHFLIIFKKKLFMFYKSINKIKNQNVPISQIKYHLFCHSILQIGALPKANLGRNPNFYFYNFTFNVWTFIFKNQVSKSKTWKLYFH